MIPTQPVFDEKRAGLGVSSLLTREDFDSRGQGEDVFEAEFKSLAGE